MFNQHWWKSKSPHEGISSVLGRLAPELSDRNTRWARYLSVFHNKTISSLTPGSTPTEAAAKNALTGEKRLALNPIRSCVDTLAARIASSKVRPQFLTSTSGPEAWTLRRQARQLQKAVEGEFARGKV